MDACKQSVIVTRFSLMISIGHSNYVTEEQARSLGLVIVESSSFILRADDTTTLSASGPGRNSFRISSNNIYGTHVAMWVNRQCRISCQF